MAVTSFGNEFWWETDPEVQREAMAAEARMAAARQAQIDAEVDHAVNRLRVREDARDRLRAERNGTAELAPPTRLDEFLAVPDEPEQWRVDGLWPVGGRVLLTAAQKAGKTTLTGNLIRALVDGDEFLGRKVEPVERVVLIDNELDSRMLRRWLRDHQIARAAAVDVLPLRGAVSSFDVLDPATRSRWAGLISGADLLVIDCLRPIIDALALDENKDAGRVLVALDELCREAGIGELLVVHHMGHHHERARGDSRILDWSDATWRLVREAPDDPSSPRYFSAHGRIDREVPEQRLGYDFATRRLSVAGGGRAEVRREELAAAVLLFVGSSPGASQRAIEAEVGGHRDDVRAAVRTLVADGVLRVERKGRAHHHFLAEGTES